MTRRQRERERGGGGGGVIQAVQRWSWLVGDRALLDGALVKIVPRPVDLATFPKGG